jgi:phage terminase large subunit-like protein
MEAGKQDLINRAKLGPLANSEAGQEVRRRCEQDLFWLARWFTWNTSPWGVDKPVSQNEITRETHQEVCDFFVKKDKKKSVRDQDAIKNRLLLFPRNGLKTTCDIVDIVQWIMNFPDIRILVLTATPPLANGIVSEVKGHFLIREDLSWMNLFFPEFCLDEKDREAEGWFTCPVWRAKKIDRREPTVMAASVEETLAGFHFEVAKADDTVSPENTGSPQMCLKITNKLTLHNKMLMRWGYWDKIGTRYQEHDDYGVDLERLAKRGIKPTTLRPGLEYAEDEKTRTKILIGRAVVKKKEVEQRLAAEKREISYENAGESGCYVLLPRLISFEDFLIAYDKNALDTEGQLNQDPDPPLESTDFTHQMMVDAIVSRDDDIPRIGPVSIVWDFAFSKEDGDTDRDYSTATVVLWTQEGIGYVIDFIQQRFNPTELADAVAESIRDWSPAQIGIEDAAGSCLLKPQILQSALRLAKENRNPKIYAIAQGIRWFKVDNQKGAKNTRIRALHTPIKIGQLKFARYVPNLEVLQKEFERWPRSKRNDGADSLAHQMGPTTGFRPQMQMAAYNNDTTTFSYRDKLANMAYLDILEPEFEDFVQPLVPVALLPEPVAWNTHPEGLPQIFGVGWTA